ncbi:MAG: hypothetical protein HY005_03305 [Candidatus Staskawiczbacteria bacterium]|nr:hypothetical protein [Candidatus Staskawiczbacteria bacterium]MBI3337616.1 hypothetical protein [Candidatus Staskawiczbacteria bacterium]
MNTEERKDLKGFIGVLLFVFFIFGFLIFICIAEKNYIVLTIVVFTITIGGIFRVIGGAVMLYQEKLKK